MNTIHLKNILLCINNSDNFESLLAKGLTYGQIASTLVQAETEGFLELGDKEYIITEKGKDIIKNAKPFEEKKIRKEYFRKDTITLEDIYIPEYNGGNKRNIEN